MTNGASANVVLGQADFTGNSANRGGAVAANTLRAPHACVYGSGKLFVADADNHRVLIWNGLPTTNGQSADIVLGQADMTSALANRGAAAPAVDTLSRPTGLRFDGSRIYVADQQNNRVLIYGAGP